jgi:uncharacterized protein YqeY
MSKIDEVRAAMFEAMKAKDKDRKDALSALLTVLKNKAIDKRADLTEAEEAEVINKEIRQTQETIDLAPADRTDIIDACKKRIEIMKEYAPAQMSEEEIRQTISSVVTGLGIDKPSKRDQGRIMKELMPKVKGKADGALVSRLVGEILQ